MRNIHSEIKQLIMNDFHNTVKTKINYYRKRRVQSYVSILNRSSGVEG